jgi:hypothetical protein
MCEKYFNNKNEKNIRKARRILMGKSFCFAQIDEGEIASFTEIWGMEMISR